MSKELATGCLLLSMSVCSAANAMPTTIDAPGDANGQATNSPLHGEALGTVLHRLQLTSGIEFILAPDLVDEEVSLASTTNWRQSLPVLLANYNYASKRLPDGRLTKVIITGHRVDDESIFAEVPALASASLPERFRDLPPGTVVPVDFNADRLFDIPLGEKTAVKLPTGHYAIVHDNVFEHANGDRTWVGYLDGEGTDYRMIVTVGSEGVVGQILTPEGLFRVEIADGKSWIVDVDSAGLRAQTMAGDEHADVEGAKAKKKRKRNKRVSVDRKTQTPAPQANPAPTPAAVTAAAVNPKITIDLMALYTPGFAGGAASTRLNFLVAATNQAYLDSQVNISLRLVYSQGVRYSETTSNSTALGSLTNASGEFSIVPALRKKYGADLVTLLRPFKYQSQLNCGSAWVGGSNGSAFRSSLGFSAVSDGTDPISRYYCTNYAMAHELGHNMGSTHDKAHSSFPGKYAFSYGHGKSGVFGTIMSYYNPQLGSFSNPNTLCKGLPCGTANVADNARSLNLTAPTIAGFASTMVP